MTLVRFRFAERAGLALLALALLGPRGLPKLHRSALTHPQHRQGRQ